MRVYLAGPMTGYRHHNFEAFDAAKEVLQEQGHEVVSPADIDRQFGITGNELVSHISRRLLQEIMLVELREITQCDWVFLLPGWQKSKGVALEKAWAESWNIPVEELPSV